MVQFTHVELFNKKFITNIYELSRHLKIEVHEKSCENAEILHHIWRLIKFATGSDKIANGVGKIAIVI